MRLLVCQVFCRTVVDLLSFWLWLSRASSSHELCLTLVVFPGASVLFLAHELLAVVETAFFCFLLCLHSKLIYLRLLFSGYNFPETAQLPSRKISVQKLVFLVRAELRFSKPQTKEIVKKQMQHRQNTLISFGC